MVASGFANCLHAPRSDRSWHHANRTHGIERSPLKILAGDVFKSLPTRPEINAVSDLRIPGDRPNLWIEKMWHHPHDRIRRNDGIGVDSNKDFRIADMLQPKVQRFGLAAIGLGKDHHLTGSFFRSKSTPPNLQSSVFRTIINNNHAHIRIVGIKRALHRALDNFFLVIRRNKYSNSWPVSSDLLRCSADVQKNTIVHGKHAHGNQPPSHQNVTEKKDDR